MAGLLAGWLSGLLTGLWAGWLSGLLTGSLAGLLTGLLAGWLTRWLTGLLAGLLTGLLTGWLTGWLAAGLVWGVGLLWRLRFLGLLWTCACVLPGVGPLLSGLGIVRIPRRLGLLRFRLAVVPAGSVGVLRLRLGLLVLYFRGIGRGGTGPVLLLAGVPLLLGLLLLPWLVRTVFLLWLGGRFRLVRLVVPRLGLRVLLVLLLHVVDDGLDGLPVFVRDILGDLRVLLGQQLGLIGVLLLGGLGWRLRLVLGLGLGGLFLLLRLGLGGNGLSMRRLGDAKSALRALGTMGRRRAVVLDLDTVGDLVAGDAERGHGHAHLHLELPLSRGHLEQHRPAPPAVVGVHDPRDRDAIVVGRVEREGQLGVLGQGQVAFRLAQRHLGRHVRHRDDGVLDRVVVRAGEPVLALDPVHVVGFDGERHLDRLVRERGAAQAHAALEDHQRLSHGVVERGLKRCAGAHRGADVAIGRLLHTQAGVLRRLEPGRELDHGRFVHRGQLEALRLGVAGHHVVVHRAAGHLELALPAVVLASAEHQRLPALPPTGPPEVHALGAPTVNVREHVHHRAGPHVLVARQHFHDARAGRRRDGPAGEQRAAHRRGDALGRDHTVKEQHGHHPQQRHGCASRPRAIDHLVRGHARAQLRGPLADRLGHPRVHALAVLGLEVVDQLVVRLGDRVLHELRRVEPADATEQRPRDHDQQPQDHAELQHERRGDAHLPREHERVVEPHLHEQIPQPRCDQDGRSRSHVQPPNTARHRVQKGIGSMLGLRHGPVALC